MDLKLNTNQRISNLHDAGHNIKSELVKFSGGYVAKYIYVGSK